MLLAAPATLAWLGWEQRWVAEDAFIDLRVVQHLLAGHGPVFNLGERVEVYTNPLWVALLTILGLPFALAQPIIPLHVPLEWIAVLAGLGLSVGGLVGAELGALHLARATGARGPALPLGAAAVVAIPAYWDFATSGLETGLALGWLGLVFWALARAATTPEVHRTAWHGPLAALTGLGPVIRPDLAIFSAGFVVALLCLPSQPAGRLHPSPSRPLRFTPSAVARSAAAPRGSTGAGAPSGLDSGGGTGWWSRPRTWAVRLLAAGALPLAYQVFRMGYFATPVPNTALAKEAGLAYWEQGWRYVADFVRPYALWVPLVPLLACLVLLAGSLGARRRWPAAILLAAPPIGAALHALYVARVGGDFMHGRMLLPSFFAALLPVAVVAGTRWWHAVLPAAVVLPWAVVCALWLRPPYFNAGPEAPQSVGGQGIADERGFYVRYARRAHPVTLSDYDAAGWAQDGHALRGLAGRRRVLLLWGSSALAGQPGQAALPAELPLAPQVPVEVVAVRTNIGLTGYAAGLRVHVVDRLGLGDPLASRLELPRRGRPGHEKELPDSWAVARFTTDDLAVQAEPTDVPAARAALRCGDLAELLGAIQAPLTPERFWRNLALSWRLARLRLPADPPAAQATLCRT